MVLGVGMTWLVWLVNLAISMQWDIRQQGCIQSPCLLGSSNLRSVDNSHDNAGHRNIPRIFVSDDAADDDDNDNKNDDETADNDYSIYWKWWGRWWDNDQYFLQLRHETGAVEIYQVFENIIFHLFNLQDKGYVRKYSIPKTASRASGGPASPRNDSWRSLWADRARFNWETQSGAVMASNYIKT